MWEEPKRERHAVVSFEVPERNRRTSSHCVDSLSASKANSIPQPSMPDESRTLLAGSSRGVQAELWGEEADARALNFMFSMSMLALKHL